jgi:uncharacterized membrane protein
MKKRIFDRVLSVIGIILAICFAAVLLATIFGGIEYKEFDNSLVKGLFIVMAVLYLVIATLTIINLFSDGDVVKEIALDRSRSGSTKATAPVIKSLTRKYIKTIEGVKCKKVTLILTEYGVNLRINVKVRDLEIKETTTYIKKLLDDVFDTTLDYRFHSIDFKVQSLKSNYAPPEEKLRTETKKEVVEQKNIKLLKEAAEKAKEEEIEAKLREASLEANDVANEENDVIESDIIESAQDEVIEATEDIVDTAEEIVEAIEKDTIENDVSMNIEIKDHDAEELDIDHFPRT